MCRTTNMNKIHSIFENALQIGKVSTVFSQVSFHFMPFHAADSGIFYNFTPDLGVMMPIYLRFYPHNVIQRVGSDKAGHWEMIEAI